MLLRVSTKAHKPLTKPEKVRNHKDASEKDYLMNKCRICLQTGRIPIFGDDTYFDISEDVSLFGGINISVHDKFPALLCDACHKLLEAAILFRKTASQTERLLKDIKHNNDTFISPFKSDVKDFLLKDLHCSHNGNIENNTSNETKHRYISNNVKLKENKESSNEEHTVECCQENIANNNYNSELLGDKHILDVTKNYICSKCDIKFESVDEYTKHNRTEHKKSNGKKECVICNKLLSKQYYKQHLLLHNAGQKLQCGICKKLYSKTYYKNHVIHAHGAKHKKPRTKVYKECPICNKSYDKQYYKFHVAIHNAVRTYVCDACGKSFIQQSAFKRHSLIHDTELPFKCQLCPYRGRHLGLVKTHMKTHIGDYKYRCSQCSAQFLTKSNLNKHVLRHKGPVDFKCTTCKRGFYSKLELERHFEADHLGVKNHICCMCGKAFGYRNAMMNHQLKVHKREKLTNGKGRQPLYLEAERKRNLDTLNVENTDVSTN